jgi:hypothetical protein
MKLVISLVDEVPIKIKLPPKESYKVAEVIGGGASRITVELGMSNLSYVVLTLILFQRMDTGFLFHRP